MRIATWNLNTWQARKQGITNADSWVWAEENLNADLLILTEASIPPSMQSSEEWDCVFRPGGIPFRSGWGTVIAGKNLELRHVTHIESEEEFVIDQKYPGSLTAADAFLKGAYFATVIGIYLPFRKDSNKKFIGSPAEDLEVLRDDALRIYRSRCENLIIAGDFNHEYRRVPSSLKRMTKRKHALINPCISSKLVTFRQEWSPHREFLLDYIFLSRKLGKKLVSFEGGLKAFPDALDFSDHAPLVIEIADH
jgi:exonuclease III